jgi:hypothetical protein
MRSHIQKSSLMIRSAIGIGIFIFAFSAQAEKLKKESEKLDFNSSLLETQNTAQETSKQVQKTLEIKKGNKKRDTVVFVQPKYEAETVVSPSSEIKKSPKSGYKAEKKWEKKQFERLAEEMNQ